MRFRLHVASKTTTRRTSTLHSVNASGMPQKYRCAQRTHRAPPGLKAPSQLTKHQIVHMEGCDTACKRSESCHARKYLRMLCLFLTRDQRKAISGEPKGNEKWTNCTMGEKRKKQTCPHPFWLRAHLPPPRSLHAISLRYTGLQAHPLDFSSDNSAG